MLSYDRALWALRSWLDSWPGIGAVERGMARQGYDLQLTRYDEKGWRATFYTSGMEHSITSATASAWEATPWRATQRAAWEALTLEQLHALKLAAMAAMFGLCLQRRHGLSLARPARVKPYNVNSAEAPSPTRTSRLDGSARRFYRTDSPARPAQRSPSSPDRSRPTRRPARRSEGRQRHGRAGARA